MSKYQTIDDLIVTRIKNGSTTFFWIFNREVAEEAEQLTLHTSKEACRVVDSRLQALRKKGVISFNSKTGWTTT